MTAIANVGFGGATPRLDLLELIELFEVADEIAKFDRIAPVMTVRARHSQVAKEGTNTMLSEVGPENPVSPVAWNASARTTAINWDMLNIDLLRYAHGGLIITDEDRTEANAYGLDPEAKWFKDSIGHASAIRGRRIGITLADTGNYNASNQSTSLALNEPTADLVSAVQAVKQRFRATSVGTSNIIAVCNDVVLDLMTGLDQVRNAVAITGYTTANSTVRRTGTVTSEEVVAWFQQKFGIELIVVETRTIRSNGTPTPVIANDLYFLKSDGSPVGASFIKTATRGGNIAVPIQYRVNNPEGDAYYVNGVFGLALPSNVLGFVYSGVDS